MKISRDLSSYVSLLILFTIMVLAGCTENTKPDILEPTLILSEAISVTRTEAALSATIERHGGGELSYLNLSYTDSKSGKTLKLSSNPTQSKHEFHLTGLQPGTDYTCQLEGGTSTATLRSNTIKFSTIPNEQPKLSHPTPLSTGPLGIIVEFDIIDDGGASLTEAGCKILKADSQEEWKVNLNQENIKTGTCRLNITGLKPLATYLITPFATNSMGEASGKPLEYTTKRSIVLQQPGQLAELFGKGRTHNFDCLTIAGLMNGDDFKTLRIILGAPGESEVSFSGIKVNDIDLSDAEITEGGGPYDGKRYTIADELSTEIFADCILLKSAVLPNTAKTIARNAFARCSGLQRITLSAETMQILPSSGCNSLTEIEVSKSNVHFSSIDGVLYDYDATNIIWVPNRKSGEFHLPSSITTIGESAFTETSISRLIIPPSVKKIGRGAFAGSALEEITLPDNITYISEGMFQNCTKLTTVYLGSATEYVGNYAFDCTSLKSLYLAAEVPPYAAEEAFKDGGATILGTCTLYVPQGTKKIYSNNSQWGKFSHIEEISQ